MSQQLVGTSPMFRHLRTTETLLREYIDAHVADYVRVEQSQIVRALAYYRNDFWSGLRVGGSYSGGMVGTGNSAQRLKAMKMLASWNLPYAVVNTALTSLVGPNPRVTSRPRNQFAEENSADIDAYVGYTFDANNIRWVTSQAITDAQLQLRGIAKTGWSAKADRPVTVAVPAASYFFDLIPTDFESQAYGINCVPYRWSDFRRKAAELYPADRIARVGPGTYPSYLLDVREGRVGSDAGYSGSISNGAWNNPSTQDTTGRVINIEPWVTVWEFYDRRSDVVIHYHYESNTILMADRLSYFPFTVLKFDENGVDGRGMSDVHMLLDHTETVNQLLSLAKQIVYHMIPRLMFDSRYIDPTQVKELISSGPSTWYGLKLKDAPRGTNFKDLFSAAPVAQTPADIIVFIRLMQEIAEYQSALAAGQRGGVVGARTATEMAMVAEATKGRIQSRSGNVAAFNVSIAQQHLYLGSRFTVGAVDAQAVGSTAWRSIRRDTLYGASANFEMVTGVQDQAGPRAVMERLAQLMPLLDNPVVDKEELTRFLLNTIGAGFAVRSRPEMAKVLAAQAEAASQQGGGGVIPTAAPPGTQPLPEAALDGNNPDAGAALASALAESGDPGGPSLSGGALPGPAPLAGRPAVPVAT